MSRATSDFTSRAARPAEGTGAKVPSEASSYGESFRAASIVGGAEGLSYVIGLVRTKVVAMLLGPSGVGLIGLYLSYTSLLQIVGGLGIASSGVREVAEVSASSDPRKVGATVKALRRVCWLTGAFGFGLAVALSWPASVWIKDAGGSASDFALLGVAIFLTTISGGQTALLQGTRRIGDLARVKIASVVATTAFAILVYSLLREKGIVLVLIATSFLQLFFSWFFSRRVPVAVVSQTWKETSQRSRQLIGLGVGFMWSGILGAGVTALLGFFIVRSLGVEANGMYSAAWMLSGLFAGFILGAMGTDFYPRLTASQSDHGKMKRLVNEQTEIGILLGLPGLLATLSFAPWVIQLFYSSEFLPAAELLPWLVLGVFGQVVTWPMGYILMAKGAKGMLIATETLINAVRLAVSVALLQVAGLEGLAAAMPVTYLLHGLIMFPVVFRMVHFTWDARVVGLLLTSVAIVVAGFGAQRYLATEYAVVTGAALTLLSAVFCLRGLTARLGADHRIVRLITSVPGLRSIVAL